jgi:hypothetical protein
MMQHNGRNKLNVRMLLYIRLAFAAPFLSRFPRFNIFRRFVAPACDLFYTPLPYPLVVRATQCEKRVSLRLLRLIARFLYSADWLRRFAARLRSRTARFCGDRWLVLLY